MSTGTPTPNKSGAVAHLGERFNGIEEVEGSNPSSSTRKIRKATEKSVAFLLNRTNASRSLLRQIETTGLNHRN